MRVLVTGAAGFIGSRTSAFLMEAGHDVIAVDNFDPYYSPVIKHDRIAALRDSGLEFIEADLLEMDLLPIIESVDAVMHLAGRPGVRTSWADFDSYVRSNVLTTHRILELLRALGAPPTLVLASSSSIYGEQDSYPTTLSSPTKPNSPYGVTKLAAEQLCVAYGRNFGMPTIALRYFTVYGPGQRPDMAFHRLCEAAVGRGDFTLMGDGSQIRDFTFVDDVAAANLLAIRIPTDPGTVLNVGGGDPVSIKEVIDYVQDQYPTTAVAQTSAAPGDVLRTGADISETTRLLGWAPAVDWRSGIEAQLLSHRAGGGRPVGRTNAHSRRIGTLVLADDPPTALDPDGTAILIDREAAEVDSRTRAEIDEGELGGLVERATTGR